MDNGTYFSEVRPKPRRAGTIIMAGISLIIIGLVTLFLYQFLVEYQEEIRAESPGGNARDYLSDERYSTLHVEIDYVTGYEPDPEALSMFEDNINQYTDKTSVTIHNDDQFSLHKSNTCVDVLEELEDEHRDRYTNGNTAVLYILYVSGECSDGESTAGGVTFSGSAIAVYKETIQNNIPTQDPEHMEHRRKAETNILLHEFGHIVGLVNEMGFESQYDHEDPNNPYHSNNQNSVMYYEATYETYQDFDSYDRADMIAIKNSPYPVPNQYLIYLLWILIVVGIILIVAGAVVGVVESRRFAAEQAAIPAAGQAYQAETQHFCPNCGNPATYISTYDRWYCYNCGQYV